MSDYPLPLSGTVDETRAADGTARYPAVTTMTDLINMLRDGQFNLDVAEDIQKFSEGMEEIGCETERKVKGKITLTIDVERETDGIYFFTPDVTFKLPKVPYGRTIGWVTGDNRFTPNKPHQGNLFGTMRDVSAGKSEIR